MGRQLKSGSRSAAARAGTSAERAAPAGERVAPAAKKAAAPAQDAILIHGISPDGETVAVLRARHDRVEAGVLRPVKQGQPVSGEVLKLTPRPEFPLLCDVEVQVPAGVINAAGGSDAAHAAGGSNAAGGRDAGQGSSPRGRPAQVATDTYRENWDAIWRKPNKKTLAN